MKRRLFVASGLAAGVGGVVAGIQQRTRIKDLLRTVYRWTLPGFEIARGHESVSVESVLNSRCNSDWGGNPYDFHWGMFDAKRRLPGSVVEEVVRLSRVPTFTGREVWISRDAATLTFLVPNTSDEELLSWLMMESGMHQQAVGLVCAALGVGMVFDNRGRDGVVISPTEFEVTKIHLGPMKPGYDGSYWTSEAPGAPSPWLTGNLTDPVREGGTPLLSVLPELEPQRSTSSSVSEEALSQLLWAARGRTPHYYLAKPWGLTIPTWTGRQHLSSLNWIRNDKSFSYVNWTEDRPTHGLRDLGGLPPDTPAELRKAFSRELGPGPLDGIVHGSQGEGGLLVLGTSEDTNRALWEVGYQLFNLLVQAHSLGVSYKAHLLDRSKRTLVQRCGITSPVAALDLWDGRDRI